MADDPPFLAQYAQPQQFSPDSDWLAGPNRFALLPRHPGYIENIQRPSDPLGPDEGVARELGDAARNGNWPLAAGALGALALGAMPGGREPIRAYHGTRTPANIRFEPHGDYEIGPHFGSREQALSRLDYSGDHTGNGLEGSSVIPVDLHLQNPLTIRDPGMFDVSNLPSALGATRKFSRADISQLNQHEQNFYDLDNDAAYRRATAQFYSDVRDLLASKGYDSIRYRNEGEHPEMTQIMRELGAAPGHVFHDSPTSGELWARKKALEERLRKRGDFSYVPLNRGSVFSALTGKPLFSVPIGAGALAAALAQYGNPDQQ